MRMCSHNQRLNERLALAPARHRVAIEGQFVAAQHATIAVYVILHWFQAFYLVWACVNYMHNFMVNFHVVMPFDASRLARQAVWNH